MKQQYRNTAQKDTGSDFSYNMTCTLSSNNILPDPYYADQCSTDWAPSCLLSDRKVNGMFSKGWLLSKETKPSCWYLWALQTKWLHQPQCPGHFSLPPQVQFLDYRKAPRSTAGRLLAIQRHGLIYRIHVLQNPWSFFFVNILVINYTPRYTRTNALESLLAYGKE